MFTPIFIHKIHPKKQENLKKKTTHLAKNTMEGVKSS